MPNNRPVRLAYFSPLPPSQSGISDYSSELLPHLNQLAKLTLFVKNPSDIADNIRNQYLIRSIKSYPEDRWQFDLALYHLGNSVFHEYIYPFALRYPGLVVLHDYVLHHFIIEKTVARDRYSDYVREMGYAMGPTGANMAWSIRNGIKDHPLIEIPLNSRLVDRSLGIIVHSETVAQMVQNQKERQYVEVIPALMTANQGQSLREYLEIPAGGVIFATIGQVTSAKQLDFALKSFVRLQKQIAEVYFLIVGGAHTDVDVEGLINEFGLRQNIKWTGYIPDLDRFVDYATTADVVVNLRYPSVGETSATALRAMAAGRPVIVFDHGWYQELPDDVCLKVPPMNEDAFLASMFKLAKDPSLRQETGRRAREYIIREHDPEIIAGQYMDFIYKLLGSLKQQITRAK